MPRILFQNLSKVFADGTQALRKVDLEVNDGELLAVVGPSGCGKTTLLRILSGLEVPTTGKVFLGDREITRCEPKDRDLGMVFQNYALFPHLSVFDNMAFGLKARGHSAADTRSLVEPVAQRLELSDLLKRKPSELSGGQRQRVALGRLLARNPAIHLLDEPLSNLDAHLRSSTRQELARLHRENRRTTLFVTHDQTEAMTLGERICVMREGRIRQVGTPREIYDFPVDRFVAEFFGSPRINLFDGQLKTNPSGQSFFHLEGTRLALPAGCNLPGNGAITLGLRPEDLRPNGPDANGPDSSLLAVYERVEDLGDARILHLKAMNQSITVRTRPSDSFGDSNPSLTPDWSKAHWFDSKTGLRIQE
tara:strand:+ start:390 stop:1481 length:1092 start_codon:yes stop_codon:yes gene_type:complete